MFWDEQDWLDKKVIAVTEDSIKVGLFAGFHDLHGRKFPLVEFAGVEHLCFSLLLPYEQSIYEMLGHMPPLPRYEWVCNTYSLMRLRDMNHKKGS